MKAKQLTFIVPALVYLLSLSVVFFTQRTDLFQLLAFYVLSFSAYLFIYLKREHFTFKRILVLSGLIYLVAIIAPPLLSNDVFRFLWDGEVTLAGINPFDYKPNELTENAALKSLYFKELYVEMGELSQRHYTCYPTINQFYFLISAIFSDSVYINTVIMKILIVLTEIIGGIYLIKLLNLFSIERNRIWLLFLNPLWIIESVGNLHFEGVMISFLFIAFYYLFRFKLLRGSLFFTLAVLIKLIPLFILPFFFSFFKFGKVALFYGLTITLSVLLIFVYIDKENFPNFVESLVLYFKIFEFNSFVLFHYISYGRYMLGWNPIRYYGPRLTRYTILALSFFSLYGKIDDYEKLFKRLTLAFFIYLLFSSTVHPWYILPLLAFSLFTSFTFPLYWTFIIPVTYLIYIHGSHSEITRRIVNLEYITLILLFLYEAIKGKTVFDFLQLTKENK